MIYTGYFINVINHQGQTFSVTEVNTTFAKSNFYFYYRISVIHMPFKMAKGWGSLFLFPKLPWIRSFTQEVTEQHIPAGSVPGISNKQE